MFIFIFFNLQVCLFLDDVSNQANLLLTNLKEIIDKLQAKNISFQNQVKKLKIENKQLIILNKKLSIDVNYLKKELKTNNLK